MVVGNQVEYARYKDVCKQTVTDWKQRGLVAYTADRKVDFTATDKALFDHGIRRDDWTDSGHSAAPLFDKDGVELLSRADAEILKENYAARLKQLEYARESARYVMVDDAAQIIRSEYDSVRAAINSMSGRLAPKLVDLKSAEEVMAAINAEVVAVLTAISDDATD